MPNLRTGNHKAKRAEFRRVHAEAFTFHEKQVAKLTRTGKLEKLKTTAFVRRQKQVVRFWRKVFYAQSA